MEQTVVTAKKPWNSKSLWFNTLTILGAVAFSVFGVDLGLTPEIQEAIALGGVALVNVILRLVTKSPIGVK